MSSATVLQEPTLLIFAFSLFDFCVCDSAKVSDSMAFLSLSDRATQKICIMYRVGYSTLTFWFLPTSVRFASGKIRPSHQHPPPPNLPCATTRCCKTQKRWRHTPLMYIASNRLDLPCRVRICHGRGIWDATRMLGAVAQSTAPNKWTWSTSTL